jgi:hypothetical protein
MLPRKFFDQTSDPIATNVDADTPSIPVTPSGSFPWAQTGPRLLSVENQHAVIIRAASTSTPPASSSIVAISVRNRTHPRFDVWLGGDRKPEVPATTRYSLLGWGVLLHERAFQIDDLRTVVDHPVGRQCVSAGTGWLAEVSDACGSLSPALVGLTSSSRLAE